MMIVSTCFPCNGPKLRRFLGAMAGLSISVISCGAAGQEVAVSFSGNLGSAQTDYLGLFGPVGGDLSGQPFSVSFKYDSGELAYDNRQCEEQFPWYCAIVSGTLTTNVTISGVTQSLTNLRTANAVETLQGIFTGMTVGTNQWGVGIQNCQDGTGTQYWEYGPCAGPNWIIDYNTQPNSITSPGKPTSGTGIYFEYVPHPYLSDASEALNGVAGGLSLVSPFLLDTKDYGNLDLATLLPNQTTPDSATALAADGTSAALVLFQVPTMAPVTFTTNNGTTLIDYKDNHDFFSKPPSSTPGNSTVTVIPISIGSLIYAVALLQAPPAGVTPIYTTPIVITSQQSGGQMQQAYLPLVPPPVLLVHGIWGDDTSLSSYYNAIISEAPWLSAPQFVDAMVYPSAAAFNSPGSIELMQREVSTLISSQQAAGIVGSRTDIVAHSMGGLLLRSYSGTKSYRSDANREQGQFHTIITLDTPEAGSALATYLLMPKHENATISTASLLVPSIVAVWDFFCGKILKTGDVEQCFAHQDKSISSGAVASLEPTNPVLHNIPSPNIPDATWRAITATNTSGAENFVLTEHIAAISPNPYKARSLTQILGGENDDIVALSSQLDVIPPLDVTFSGLAHTALFKYPRQLNSAVTNAPAAISLAACWLNDPTNPSCASAAKASPAAYESDGSVRLVTGRVAIHAPSSGTIGQPMPISINAPNATGFVIEQLGKDNDSARGAVTVADEIDLPSAAWDGSYLTVLPRVLGSVRLQISTSFSDGTIEVDDVGTANFSADPKSIVSVRADRKFHEIVFPQHDEHVASPLYPIAFVQGLNEPVKIGKLASYRLVSPSADAPVILDSHGMITPVRAGTAIVEVSFEGHTDELRVVVK